uniref:Uncharacterized protein n=1 Tax=mine drainage metagenome TaxID=410659 RepID=E6Q517_9ZZZZ
MVMRVRRIGIARIAYAAVPALAFFWLVRAWFAPGLIVGEDFRPTDWLAPSVLRASFPWPHLFDPTFLYGYSLQIRLPLYPLMFVGGALAHFGLPWSTIERVLILFPLAFAIVMVPYSFGLRFLRSAPAAAVMSLAFSLNSWSVGMLQRGHLPALLAYALLPLVLWQTLRLLRACSWGSALLLALIVTAQVNFDFRYALLSLLAGLPLFCTLMFRASAPRPWRRWLLGGTFFVAALALLNFYWWLPSLLAPPYVPTGFFKIAAVAGASGGVGLLGAIALHYPYYHHLEATNAFASSPPGFAFLTIGLLSMIGLVIGRRSMMGSAAMAIWIGGVILVAGMHGVFGTLVQTFYLHVPGIDTLGNLTKIFAALCFAGAFGLGRLVQRAIALFRLRTRGAQRRWWGAFVVVLVALGYLLTLHDAYNPLRYSVFGAYHRSANERAFALALQREPTGRVIYFPDLPEWLAASDRHPAMQAATLSSYPWPFGLAAIGANSSGYFEIWRSPAMHDALCTLGARYVAVEPDRFGDIYRTWQVAVERGEVVQFFSRLPWLRRLTLAPGASDRANEARFVVYRIERCHGVPPLLRTARLPIAVEAEPSLLGALSRESTGLPAASAIFGSVGQGAGFTQRLPNVAVSSVVLPANGRYFGTSPSRAVALLNDEYRAAQLEKKAARFYLFSGHSTSKKDRDGFIESIFSPRYGGVARLSVVALPVEVTNAPVFSRSGADLRGTIATTLLPRHYLIDPSQLRAYIVGEAPAPGLVALASNGRSFALVNPYPFAVDLDLRLPRILAIGIFPAPYDVLVNGVSERFLAEPSWLARLLPGPGTVLRGLHLPSGTSILTIERAPRDAASANVPLLVGSSMHLLGALTGPASTPVGLGVTLRRSMRGLLMRSDAMKTGSVPAIRMVRIVQGLDQPVADAPSIWLSYIAPSPALSLRLGIRLRGGGGDVTLLEPLPCGKERAKFDVASSLRAALKARDRTLLREHRSDPAWIRQWYQRPHARADDYRIRAIDLFVEQPPGRAVEASWTSIRALSIHLPIRHGNGPVQLIARHVDLSQARNARIIAVKNLIATVVKQTPHSLRVHLDAPASEPRSPEHVLPGDRVVMILNTGARIEGDVIGVQRAYIMLDAAGRPTAVRRDSVTMIERVFAGSARSFTIALQVPAMPPEDTLSFSLSEEGFRAPRISLLFQNEKSGATATLFPQGVPLGARDRALDHSWRHLRADWRSSPPEIVERPRVIGREIPLARTTEYQISLEQLVRRKLHGDPNERLVGARLKFSQLGGSAPPSKGMSVALSDLRFVRWGAPGQLPHSRILPPVVRIDGKNVRDIRWSVMHDAMAKSIVGSVTLRVHAGVHRLAVLPTGDYYPETATLRVGAAKLFTAPLRAARRLNASEVTAQVAGNGARLVEDTAPFNDAWQLALLPRGAQPSGDPLVDLLRFHGDFVPRSEHALVNGCCNAWWLPHARGRLLELFVPAAFARAALLAELLALIALIALGISSRLRKRVKS